MKRWGPLAILGMPFLLVACQAVAGSNGPTIRATVPAASASASATPSAVPSAETGLFTTPCSAGQLAVRWGGLFGEPTGQHTVPLTISNISTNGCYLSGYPQVAFADSAGRVLPLQYQTTGDQVVTSAPPRHVDLAPHGLAYVTVNKYRCDTTDLVQASSLRLTPPGLTSSFDVSLAENASMDYCGPGDPGSTVHVSPVEPNFSDTLPQ
ncbi:MAG TPA: DUF4232 domain-containing protein [Candidatus Dormibacteraeota bacterium]|nr:DUF4232 domain-containing protein [Candidatus Dormibacteraeota bacterium]